MSRVGKKPIPLPTGVKFTIGEELKVEGPKGKLTVPIPPGIRIEQKAATLELVRENDNLAAMHGLTRALAANAVHGVSTGFVRELDIVGTGYRVDVKGKVATLHARYSHPDRIFLPNGIDMKVDKQTHVVLTGYDRQELGHVAAQIRALRPPIPTRTRASGTPAKPCARRPARPAREVSNGPEILKAEIRPPHSQTHPQPCRGNRSAPSPSGVSAV